MLFLLQTNPCDAYSLNLTYHSSQNVTQALLRQFYNGFVLHRRFIEEKLLIVKDINRLQKKQLGVIMEELEHNIAHIYYLVSFGFVQYLAK